MEMKRSLFAVLLAAILIVPASGAAGQDADQEARIRPTGVRALVGVAVPEDADAAVLLGGAVNLGTVWKPWMHLSAGATRWSSDLDASAYGNREGSLRDLRVFTNVGLEFMEVSGVQGYVDVGLGVHFLDFTVPNEPALAEALGGTNLGAEMAWGLASTAGRFRISAEVRRQFVDDAGNWSFVVGVETRWDKQKAEPQGSR